jgi:hypothetical protein
MSSELDELGKTGVFLALAFPDALPRGALDEEAPFFFFTGRVLGLIYITENQKKESRTKKEIKMKRSGEGKRMKGLLFISGKITKT